MRALHRRRLLRTFAARVEVLGPPLPTTYVPSRRRLSATERIAAGLLPRGDL